MSVNQNIASLRQKITANRQNNIALRKQIDELNRKLENNKNSIDELESNLRDELLQCIPLEDRDIVTKHYKFDLVDMLDTKKQDNEGDCYSYSEEDCNGRYQDGDYFPIEEYYALYKGYALKNPELGCLLIRRKVMATLSNTGARNRSTTKQRKTRHSDHQLQFCLYYQGADATDTEKVCEILEQKKYQLLHKTYCGRLFALSGSDKDLRTFRADIATIPNAKPVRIMQFPLCRMPANRPLLGLDFPELGSLGDERFDTMPYHLRPSSYRNYV